ncbi:MAG: hypothetical protein GX132_03970 [Erysipelotrichia bacterium]|nr:hypothetical protein [Erysipelotrichia bacterium]
MKTVLKEKLTYLYAGILFLISSLIAIVPDLFDEHVATMEEWHAHYIFLFIGVVYIFIGFIWQDLIKARQRRATKNWDGPLEKEVILKAAKRFAPFLVAGLLSILMGIIFTFIPI